MGKEIKINEELAKVESAFGRTKFTSEPDHRRYMVRPAGWDVITDDILNNPHIAAELAEGIAAKAGRQYEVVNIEKENAVIYRTKAR